MTEAETRGRVVVLGGYGTFGTRICRALAKANSGEILIAGRSRKRAQQLATELVSVFPNSKVDATELDCFASDLAHKLDALRPAVVVHTVGPFQGQDYRVARACVECRSHYVDLADARRFVVDFGALDQAARVRDVLLVSGASTLPGISSAVVDALRADLTSVSLIEISIAPAGRSTRGEATVAAVLSYCGKPFQTFESGTWTTRYGWQDRRSVHYLPFARRVAVCDVPDLELFPQRYGAQTVTFHAGPESRWQLWAAGFMATLTRARIVQDWSKYARRLAVLDSCIARFGAETGAMQVRIRGTNALGESVDRSWNLTAGRNHGPQIPCVPAIVLAKKMLRGTLDERGARSCVGMLDLRDVAVELAEFDIRWQVDEETQ